MTEFTVDNLRRVFSVSSFDRGQRYQFAGRARVTRISPDGSAFEGKVRGSGSAPYHVSAVARRLDPGQLAISGECSCPVGFDCKHVVALLLQALAEGTTAPSTAAPKLSPEVAAWLTKIERAGTSSDEDYPPEIHQRLIYVLAVLPDWHGIPRPALTAMSVRLRLNGEFSDKASALETYNVINSATPAKYLRPSDHIILRRMAPLQHHSGASNGRTLAGESGAEILAQALATGRCRWLTIHGPILSLGEARKGSVRWVFTADGRQRPEAVLDGAGLSLSMTPPWYSQNRRSRLTRVLFPAPDGPARPSFMPAGSSREKHSKTGGSSGA